ncbi:MAG: hypothetical protein V4805_16315 [Pseudomonadota bacterium]
MGESLVFEVGCTGFHGVEVRGEFAVMLILLHSGDTIIASCNAGWRCFVTNGMDMYS